MKMISFQRVEGLEFLAMMLRKQAYHQMYTASIYCTSGQKHKTALSVGQILS